MSVARQAVGQEARNRKRRANWRNRRAPCNALAAATCAIGDQVRYRRARDFDAEENCEIGFLRERGFERLEGLRGCGVEIALFQWRASAAAGTRPRLLRRIALPCEPVRSRAN